MLRFLSVPHPHCDALHAVGLKLGWGRGASKHTRPFHNLPPRRTAPLACGLFNHSPEKKKRRHSTRHAAGLQQRHLRSKIQ